MTAIKGTDGKLGVSGTDRIQYSVEERARGSNAADALYLPGCHLQFGGDVMKRITRAAAKTPAELLRLLSERIKAKDLDGIIALHEPEAAVVNYDESIVRGHEDIRAFYVEWFKSDPVLTVNPRQTVVAGGKRGSDGKVRGRTAAIMGDYTLEQTGPDGTRESFTGNFCDTVQEQRDGTWLYVQDNPYPPHGTTAPGPGHGDH